MSTISCASCGLPNDLTTHRCHACGARMHPESDDPRGARDLEEQLEQARNRLADLDWRVRGSGWVAVGVLLSTLLVMGPPVGHRVLGDAVDCGTPLGALRGEYKSRYAATLWQGCADGTTRWALVAAGAAMALVVGAILLTARAFRLRSARAAVLRLQEQVHVLRAAEETRTP